MKRCWLVLVTICFLAGTYLRLHHIEFGLPHSFHADEPEIAELAIKYTYEIRNIIRNNNYYKLIPISYVYGTFPAYILTLAVMIFSKTANILNLAFDKTTLYIFMRSLNSILSLLIIPTGGILYYKIFKDKWGALVTVFLLAFNWKLIVHAHYINADIILTVLLTLSYLAATSYYKNKLDNKRVLVLAAIVGLALGTKITTLLTLPLFAYLFFVKKDYRGFFGFLFTLFIFFAISNPFTLIYPTDFAFRVFQMKTKEGGLVFDSVNTTPFKYLLAAGFISTPLVFLSSLYGKINALKQKENLPLHIFLIGHVVIYLIFYSTNTRRVDRWLLPILPIFCIYATHGFTLLKQQVKSWLFISLGAVALCLYLYYPTLLLKQYQRHTPKSASYLWMRDNIDPSSNKLTLTEEGLDPLNKLEGILVLKYEVYESQAAQFFLPPNPDGYDYVILASKPMKNFKRPAVRKKYPWYAQAWDSFEEKMLDINQFELVKDFTIPKPNLVNLSDVYIYKNKRLITKKSDNQP